MRTSASPRLDAVLGCLVGGAVGDSAASTVEGHTFTGDLLQLPWRWTDDTQLTLATCEALVAAGRADPEAIADHMLRWFRAGRLSGLGASTRAALNALRAGSHWALAGVSGEFAAGNGAAMRAAPLAFFLDLEDHADRRTLRDIARITHKNDEAYAGALAVVLAVRSATSVDQPEPNDLLAPVAASLPDSRTRDALLSLVELRNDTPTYAAAAEATGTSGFVAESVPLALFAAELGLRDGFASVLHAVVRQGGDVDTIASITGQVLGARVGLRGLPPEFVAKVPDLESIHAIGEKLAESILAP